MKDKQRCWRCNKEGIRRPWPMGPWLCGRHVRTGSIYCGMCGHLIHMKDAHSVPSLREGEGREPLDEVLCRQCLEIYARSYGDWRHTKIHTVRAPKQWHNPFAVPVDEDDDLPAGFGRQRKVVVVSG